MGSRDVWAFDVDGCLVDLLGGTSLRPHAQTMLEELRRRGHLVVLWSAGGADHARRRAAATGIADLVDGYYDKQARDAVGRWTLEHLAPDHRPTVCVDDCPEEVPANVRIVGVRPYLAPSQHDDTFAELLDGLAAG
jgi:hypothetical protein